MSDIPDINTKSEGDLGYVAGYSGKKIGVYAPSLLAAKERAIAHFKPRKSQAHMVWITLAQLADGTDVWQHAS